MSTTDKKPDELRAIAWAILWFVPIILMLPFIAITVILYNIGKRKNEYLKSVSMNVLIGFDQLVNAMLAGDPDETISSRMGKAIREDRCVICKIVCPVLDKLFGQKNHCVGAIEEDEGSKEVQKI